MSGMIKKSLASVLLALGASGFVLSTTACSKEEAPAPAPTTMKEGAAKAGDAMKEGAAKAGDAMKAGADKAADAMKAGADKAGAAMSNIKATTSTMPAK